MHGREGEERKRRRHMRSVPAPGTPASALPPPARLGLQPTPSAYDSLRSSVDYFIKDGRKIRVGDCALFQAGNAPPFIGIIRRFSTGKEDYLKLYVNWLYRPADVKLAKRITPEAAPNEVFYSFHKDVISAASLLHPCRVAFLRKGVELPAGISSFVCRRVYDITNKCLWWLTDQDYINERQEEVDQLLDKTRLEMHAAVQSGGRSPKPLNGPTSTQQPKSGSDSVQNSGTSFPSQAKGKKRDRGDQGAEPLKRERSVKTEDGDSVNFKFDNMIRSEIAKITEKGGLVNSEGVEKLVNLMQLDRNERKIDLADRVMLAGVIAATDKYECLGRFVQLMGVPVLDDWLQEAHKGKTGDGNSPKECDKATEELLLALLRALDKLPVNLHALKTCNIGKSVNHLRSYKNLEIQKKARSLVDTWKKRVDAEMKISDVKSVGSSQAVAWPVKPGFSEVSHAGNRRAVSSEVTVKSPMNQPSPCKTLHGKPGHADSMTKTTPVTPGSLKLQSPALGTISKDLVGKTGGGGGTQELPSTAVKEEKSSSSSQSQNNSQSCSSDHAKTMGSSWKEDARSSTAGSVNASKTSGGSSRHRRSGNGLLGTSNSGVQKEPNLGKSGSLNRTMTLDKVSQSGLTCEKTLDVPVTDHGNSHRLIVRLPNPGRSPAQSGSGGSFEDPSVTGSRASSPGAFDKHEHNNRKMKLRSDTCRSHITTDANAESWQSNDVKEGVIGSDEADRSPIGVLDEERRSAGETGKVSDVPRTACSSSGNEKEVFLSEPRTRNSFSSINALIESCAKYSEACAPLLAGDDIGMNLLASVATGEMSKSDLISPTGSPGTSPAREDPCAGNNEAKSRLSCDDGMAQNHAQSDETADVDSEKHGKSVGSVLARGESQQAGTNFPVDNKTITPLQDHRLTGEQTEQSPVSSTGFHRTTDSSVKLEGKLEEERADRCFSMSSPANVKEESEGDGAYPHRDKWMTRGQVTDSCTDCKPNLRSPSVDESETIDCAREKIGEGSTCASGALCNSLADASEVEKTVSSRKSEKMVVEESPSSPIDKELPGGVTLTDQQQPPVAENHAEALDRSGDDAIALSGADKVLCPENEDEYKTKKSDNVGAGNLDFCDSERRENSRISPSSIDERGGSTVVSLVSSNGIDGNLEIKEPIEVSPAGAADNQLPCSIPPQVTGPCVKSSGSRMSGADADGKVELASSAEASSLAVTAEPDVSAKLDFDLNKGIPGDDVNQGEPVTSAAPVCSSAVHMPNLSPFASPMLNGLPAPITVAAPAKGPFVPPDNLLKSKAEPGWKGSAATSAFRPAEPRKVLEMPLGSEVPADAAGKQGRPHLDIDLNVPDEKVLEDMASRSPAQTTGSESRVISSRDAPTRTAGGLDLDLNRVDEGTENGHFLASTSHGHFLASTSRRLEVPLLPARPASGGFSSGEANILRDFDLNNGPGLDEVGSEPAPRSQHVKNSSSMPFLPPVAGVRLNNAGSGNVSSWFPPSNSYPAVAIPSFLPDRGEQPYSLVAAPGTQRILGSVTGGGTFGNDIYRGPVLSSSPAMAFSHATAFSYAGFPFGSSFPLASTSFSGGSTTYVDSSSGGASCFPVISSQLVGPAGAVSSHYPRPYVISLPESSTSGGSDNSRKWARQGLDLNAGPGSVDVEGKDNRLPSASRQLLVATSQAFVEEQARMFQVPGGGLKRKEPEGGWDAERSSYKQLSRQ